MKASAIVAAIGVGVLATALAKPTGLPSGWLLTGSAKTCEGQVLPVDGGPSPKAFSIDCKPGTEGFSSLMQQIGSADYAGKRVRLSAQVHGDQLAAWGGLWMRADSGQRPGTAFDNMNDRPLRGSRGPAGRAALRAAAHAGSKLASARAGAAAAGEPGASRPLSGHVAAGRGMGHER